MKFCGSSKRFKSGRNWRRSELFWNLALKQAETKEVWNCFESLTSWEFKAFWLLKIVQHFSMKQLTSKLFELHKFEASCLRGKINRFWNSQDVKDSKEFKTSSVSTWLEAFWGPTKFPFLTDLKLNLLLVLSSLHLTKFSQIWYECIFWQ